MTDVARTPDAAPSARRVGLIAFAAWPAIVAVWVAWLAYRLHRSDVSWWLAYEGSWVAIAAIAIAPLPLLVWAGRGRRLGPALLGLALGGIAALALALLGRQAIVDLRERDFQAKQARLEAFAATVRSGDPARIRAGLAALPEQPTPAQALCALSGGPSYRYVRWLWFDEQAYGPRQNGADLLVAAAAVVAGPATREAKQSALRVVLRALAEHETDGAHFARWAQLWRTTLPAPVAAAPLLFEDDGDPEGCRIGDPAERVLRQWQGPGLQAWLDAGFGFGPGQSPAALRAVESRQQLARLLDAAPAIATQLREDPVLGARALSAQADGLSKRLDAASRPAALAETIEALRAAGADPVGAGSAWTACDRFLDDERNSESDATGTAERNAAAERIRAALCPAGKTVAATTGRADSRAR
ncbi:hypothetical protein K4L06_05705 [Lysobacter sp. BMK333-48F3]|uniref:hypothetical protein n=1 Tax=Lysobacter sp. BMK333-48F3 TaxID=2867962 RepID=UPI001C8BA0C2|nr:hypothetical protein [Lysobacter sp. BMK333-48F3]MBX9400800.1 hypothetical protein [Lysobacter sp. BMK333-48F3]